MTRRADAQSPDQYVSSDGGNFTCSYVKLQSGDKRFPTRSSLLQSVKLVAQEILIC